MTDHHQLTPNKKNSISLLQTLGLKKKKSNKTPPKATHKNITRRAATFSSPSNANLEANSKAKEIYSDIPKLNSDNGTTTPKRQQHGSTNHSYSSGTSDRNSQLNGFYNLPIAVGQSSHLNQNGTKDNSSLLSDTNRSYMGHSRYSVSEPNLSLHSLENNPQRSPVPPLSNAQELLNAVFNNKNSGTNGQHIESNTKNGIHDQTMNNAKQLLQTFDDLLQKSNQVNNGETMSQTEIQEPKPKSITDNNQIKFLDLETPKNVSRETGNVSNTLTTSLSSPTANGSSKQLISRPSDDIRRISLDLEPQNKKKKQAIVKSGSPSNKVMLNQSQNNTSDSCLVTAALQPRRSFTPMNVKDIPGTALKLSLNTARAGTNLVTGSFSRTRGNSTFSGSPVSSKAFIPQESLDSDDETHNKYKAIQGVTYANEGRNKEFHKLFKMTPQDERLISIQSTALFKDIVLQGKLYICDYNIYFYSNILGYITTYIIPYIDILSVDKKTIAGIFPNAISIDTEQTKYIFGSLGSREVTLSLIRKVWHQRKREILHPRDSITSSSQQVSESGSESESDEDEDEDWSSESSESILDDDKDMATAESPSTMISESTGKVPKANSSEGDSIPTLGLSKHEPTKAAFVSNTSDKRIYDSVIAAPLGKVINILFGEDTSYLETILKHQGNYDLSSIPTDLLSTKTRDYSYTKPLSGSIGPSKTKCLVTETLDIYDLDGFVQVTQVTKNPDVPSGNAFVSCTTFVLSWDKSNATRMAVYVRVDWSGSSWIKGAIEKGTIEGVTSATKSLADEIIKMVTPKETKPKKSRRGTSVSRKAVSTLPNLEPFTHAPTSADMKNEPGEKIIKKNYIFDCSLGTIYQLIFGDDTSYLKHILTKQNNIDISIIPTFEDKKRTYNYVKLLNNSIGPKQTKCSITETIEHMDMNGYILVKQISKTPDVPSGNSFTVQTRFYFSWGPDNTTIMNVITNVVWTGRSFLKNAIEKGSIDGQEATIEIMIDELSKIIEKAKVGPKLGKKKSGTRSRKTSTRSVTTTETKGPEIVEKMGVFGFISKAFSPLLDPLIKNFDPMSPQTIGSLIISIVLLTSLFRFFFVSKKPTHHVSLLKHERIMIDDDIYNYTPALDTLYKPYRETLETRTGKQKNASSRNKFQNNEDILGEDIWDWIKDRGNPRAVSNTVPHFDKPNVKNQNLEELQEAIKIANIQLEEMKKKEIKDQHVKRLKTYNELRDIGLRLVQIIADDKKCTLKDVFEEMGDSMADD
ncbi:hypothetical protein C6P45_004181 [Maudiozyma exigua]|uniref:VASt domain-containing protein n=1 Tax=Maudiozyma exigua TaxID=34358 RepID=A0A9P6WD36_MAUEX|nr:hypothetical protein C6P45_004181 [Kazachstania exigua]